MSSPEPRRRGAAGTRLNSLQWRLGAGLLLGFGLLFSVLFVLLDTGVDRALYARFDRYLLARAEAVTTLLADEQSNHHPDLPPHPEALLPEFGVDGHQDFYAVWNRRGELLQQSLSVGRGRFQPPPQWPAAAPLFYDLDLPDGHRGRAVVRALRLPSSGQVYLAVSQEREDLDRFERQLHHGLLAASVLGLLLAALLTIVLVRWALQPLHRLGVAAAALDPEHPPPALDDPALPRELRPLAASLDRALGRLYAAVQRERRFARDVAHELRTPLAELRTRAELALRDADAERQREALHAALAASERLQQSVDGLLQLARYEAGHEQPQHEPVDLVALLAIACSTQRLRADARGLSMRCLAGEECWVHSDPVLLARVLDNLLGNAVAHASAGGAVQVSLLHEATAGAAVRVRIENPAAGLSADDLAHFGERFWRGPAAADGPGHSGLGLALAHGIAGVLGLRLSFRLDAGVLVAELGPLATV